MTGRPVPRILIVDDDVIVRTVLARRLEAAGYSVQTAEDGRRGLDWVRRWRPDVVLTDCMMPGMDGPRLVRAIRADRTETGPYIVLCSSREVELGGADACLVKPWSDAELLSCVARGIRVRASEPAVVGGCG